MRTPSFFSVPLLLAGVLALSACAGASGLRKATGGLYSGQFAGASRPQMPPQYAAFAAELENRIKALEQKSQALMQRADSQNNDASGALNRLQNSKGIVMTHMQLGSAANNPALGGLLRSMQDELAQLERQQARLERQAAEAQQLGAQLTELADTSYSAAQLPDNAPAAAHALRDLRVRALIGAVPLHVLQQELRQKIDAAAPMIARERTQLPQLAQTIAASSAAQGIPPTLPTLPALAGQASSRTSSALSSDLMLPPSLSLPPPSQRARQGAPSLPQRARQGAPSLRTQTASSRAQTPAPFIVARPPIEAWALASAVAPSALPSSPSVPPAAPAAAIAPAAGSQPERAFVVFRFRDPQTRYESALARAIAEAQRRCPTGLYTIAALAPHQDAQPLADSHAQQVFATLKNLRIADERVSVMPARLAAVKSSEVHIYLR